MRTIELRRIIDSVIGDVPVVIAYDKETKAGIKKAYVGIDPKHIALEPEIILKPIDRDTPVKTNRYEYKWKQYPVVKRRCPVCDTALRSYSNYCDVCGQAVED